MRNRPGLFLLVSLLGAVAVAALVQVGAAAVNLREADRLYAERSYAKALPLYQQALAAGADKARRVEIEYRVLVSLGRSQRWDDALSRTRTFLAAHPSGLWGARGQYWLGQLLTVAPHSGYRVGKRVYRGGNYPKVAGAQKPVQVYLYQQDADEAVAAFGKAKALYERLRPRSEEETDLNFDLARLLAPRDRMPMVKALFALQKQKRPGLQMRFGEADPKEVARLAKHDWTPTPGKPYAPKQPLPQRILGLYQQVERLEPARAPEARLACATWLANYQQEMQEWMRGYDAKVKKWVALPYPYQKTSALALLQSIPNDFPQHALAPQAQLLVGQWREARSEYVSALKSYRAVLTRWPKSKWVSDARAHIQGIEWPSLNLTSISQPAGGKPKVQVSARNVKAVDFTVYRVPLAKLLLDPARLNEPQAVWAEGEHAWWKVGEKVAAWTHQTKDNGDHRPRSATLAVPVTAPGAYLVLAESGQSHASTLLLVTDLAVVLKTDRMRARVFVCDAETGKPVPDARVVIRETVQDENSHWRVDVFQGRTDAEGLQGKALLPLKRDWESHHLEVLVWVGDRYAVARGNSDWWGSSARGTEYRGYVITDRPVYRPGHSVNFRVVVMGHLLKTGEQLVGGWKPAVDTTFEVTAVDVRGEKVYQQTLTTNEFGSLNASFRLGAEPPLGRYSFQVRLTTVESPLGQLEGNQFRVEEYKKPEFEVKVTPAAEQIRVGDAVKATVEARYYFGSPVVGGKVTYRVFQTPYFPNYHFPNPHNWLFRNWIGEGYWEPEAEGGAVVASGEGRTDAKGQLHLQFAAKGGGPNPDAKAYTYTIKAEVTDPSRRVITGQGEVRASRQQYFAFLTTARGFYLENDRIEVEVMTRDVMDRPLSAVGKVRVERIIKGAAPEDVVDAFMTEADVKTDAEGHGFFQWVAPEAGYYRFTFLGTDGWKQTVTGKTYTWVQGPDMTRREFRFHGIEVIPEKRSYEEGDTCRLLIVSNFVDATVLLTQEAGSQVLGRVVLPLPGKSRVVEVKIGPNHVPNFYFSALTVHDWQVWQATTEVFVPPTDRFLNVSVSPDRPDYRPGDIATFRLRATDNHDQPVRTEVSLGVVDASVYAIQPDLAPDIRLTYYGERRGHDINESWSMGQGLGERSWNDREPVEYKRHEFAWPDHLGQLDDWPQSEQWTLGMVEQAAGRLPRMVSGYPASPAMAAKADGLIARDEMAGFVQRSVAGGGMGAGGRGGAHTPFAPDGADQIAAYPMLNSLLKREGPLAEARVRSQFADTAFWSPSVVTRKDGTATVVVTMPENLTTWRATARGVTTDAQVGQATTETVTRKNLIVRLQAPRFFMERDLVVLSANVHNYLQSAKRTKVSLALEGGVLEVVKEVPADLGLKHPATELETWVEVPKDDEQRVDWVVRVLRSGVATVRMTAQTDEESDAMEMQFPALVHGVEKLVVKSGVMRDVKGTQTATIKLDLPKERRRGATELNVQLMPSLAGVTLDALPYLANYPYGCVEQTMSRFLPSVVVAKTLKDLGLNLDDLKKRADAYAAESAAGSPAQADSAYTYPKGLPGSVNAAELASRMGNRPPSPVFDQKVLADMVQEGLARLYGQQHKDGGWGWWPDGLSDPYMTAYVVSGLHTAQAAGWTVKPDVLKRGFEYVAREMKESDSLHRMAYLASVLTQRGTLEKDLTAILTGRLYQNRMKLTPYSQALLALSLQRIGQTKQARVLVDNLENTALIDRENGTANWTGARRWWWHWWDSPVETNAAVLRATLAVDPKSELIPMMVKWMVNNRRGGHWDSTKETALAVQALAEYLQVTKELAPDYTITVDLGGKVQRTYRVNRDNALFFDNRFIVGDDFLTDGAQTVTVTVKGTGTLYYSTYLRYFSLEENLKGGGNEIFVKRRYFKLTPRLVAKGEKGRTWQELTYDRAELPLGAHLTSGDLVEVELVLEAKNDYEYVVFEDMKPAGFEPVEVRSGEGEGAGVSSHMELRDEKVALFIGELPQGTRAVRYRVRAEIPGAFHGLPTNGYAMYAPDVRCLSDEWRVTIGEGK